MSQVRSKQFVQNLLGLACIEINGGGLGDLEVRDERLYDCVLKNGSLGLGEAYMDRWWDAEPLDEFFYKILDAELDKKIRLNLKMIIRYAAHAVLNYQRKDKAFEIGEHHYNIGNDLFQAMLDKRMTYTCGYWKIASTLDEAQEAKFDLVCRKIGLRSGQTVLDIGCGWGSFAKFAAELYGAKVLGVTVSKEQVELGNELCEGLPVELRLQDYRDVRGEFDQIVSLGMFEHVGYKNYGTFMNVVHRCLKDDGLFLLHTIGRNESVKATDPWIAKYIFPNSMLPSAKQITAAYEGLFVMEDWHSFGVDYDKTLMEWFGNFNAHWGSLKRKYGDRFYRMWKYYLLSCAGSFRARKNQLWQIVLAKKGVKGGYVALR